MKAKEKLDESWREDEIVIVVFHVVKSRIEHFRK
jgi:hypothetical protein